MAQVFYTLDAALRNQFAFRLPSMIRQLGIGKTSAREVTAENSAVQVAKITALDAGIASAFRVVFHFFTEAVPMTGISFFSATIVQPMRLISSANRSGFAVVRAIQSNLLRNVFATMASRKGICVSCS